ncbi:MAG: hypothetical protein LBF78_12055, partial [Treponema sp.]|nr:hypothetical protein [Treponema sp.]
AFTVLPRFAPARALYRTGLVLTPAEKSIFVDKANRAPGNFPGGAYGETTTRTMLYAENVTLSQ